ncbi:MAG: peptidoglycan editing factor PgeF [Bryobacteraceae bacterium]
MFYKDRDHVYRVRPLAALAWLEHGFGTRHSARPRAATLHQVHSAVCIAAEGRGGCLGDGDALLENTPGSSVAVKTADCLPLLLVDPARRAVAAVHAGWRGTAQRIAQAAVRSMTERFGTDPVDLLAALGPAIGPCCYEVGAEVAARFGLGDGRARVDLAAINRGQLERMGVRPENIYSSGLCTMCNPDDFYSYRRERERAGRMYSAVGIAR